MNRTQLTLRPAAPEDEQLLTHLLAGLSPASAFHRFMAGLGSPKPALVRGLLPAGDRRGAWLAVERDTAGAQRAVGHAIWSVLEGDVADLGVVVADDAQGCGIGRALFEAALGSAREVGATAVHLDVHPENRRVAGILRARLGGRALRWEQGLLSVDAPLAAVAELASETAPLVAAAA